MRRLNEEININDPALANKFMQNRKQINDRLKKIAQLQTEISKFSQANAAIETQAIKKDAATLKASQTANKQQNQKQDPNAIVNPALDPRFQAESMTIPTYDEFVLNEEENELEDDDDEESISEAFTSDFEKTIDWDELEDEEDIQTPSMNDLEKLDPEMDGMLMDEDADISIAEDDLKWFKMELTSLENDLTGSTGEFEQFSSEAMELNVLDILSSGMTYNEKVKNISSTNGNFSKGGGFTKSLDIGKFRNETKPSVEKAETLVHNYNYYVDYIAAREEDIETKKKEIKEMTDYIHKKMEAKEKLYDDTEKALIINTFTKKLDDLIYKRDNSDDEEEIDELNKKIKTYEWKLKDAEDKQLGMTMHESESTNGSDLLSFDDDEDEDIDEILFHVRINDEDAPALIKVYKEENDDDKWELSVVEGDNTALGEMVFDDDFTKEEIIEYLADIYEDVEEVDQDFIDDVVDDDAEIEDDFDIE